MSTFDQLGAPELSAEQLGQLEDLEHQKRIKNIAVPTDDLRVRQKLQSLNEPQTYFGEGPAERRDRLRLILADKRGDEMDIDAHSDADSDKQTEEFYSHGGPDLLQSRLDLLSSSLIRAKLRLKKQSQYALLPHEQRQQDYTSQVKTLQSYSIIASQYASERPLSAISIQQSAKVFATASWSGGINLFSLPDAKPVGSLRGHTQRACSIDWHPDSGTIESAVDLCSSSTDGSVLLYKVGSETPIAQLEGHEQRVAKAKFHPSGRFIGTASQDATYRLFDVETQQEIVLQESGEKLHALAFHCDGSLVAIGGMNRLTQIYDMRSGKSIIILKGHVDDVLALSFSAHSTIASASADNTTRIFNLRMLTKSSQHCLLGHTNLVSDVVYKEVNGQEFLGTASYDGSVRIHERFGYTCVKVLEGGGDKVVGMDWCEGYIGVAGYERVVRIYGSE